MKFTKSAYTYTGMLLLLLFLLIEIPIIAEGSLAIPQKADTIIVLGAKLIGSQPSSVLRLRLDKAIKLYQENYADTIIVSGGQGDDELTSEAFIMKQYLSKQGIPPDKIFIEDQSRNTYQNLVNSQQIMKQQHLYSAIIVSNTSHIRRSLLLAKHIGLTASASPAPMADNLWLTIKQYVREGAAIAVLLAKGP